MRMTLPALMHDVHAWMRFGVPFTSARTRWMFGSQRRLIRLCENVTDLPNHGFLPQMSQTAAIAERDYQGSRADQAGWIFARPALSASCVRGPMTSETWVPFAS
jgi:hypothetical protein